MAESSPDNVDGSGIVRPPRRSKKFCFVCGLTGHRDEDCTRGTQPNDASAKEAEDPPNPSAQDSLASSEAEPNVGSSPGSTSSVSYSRPAGKKSKALKATSHVELERIYKTGEESRNPVGENFASYHNDSVIVSDRSFHEKKANSFDDFGLHPEILRMIKKIPYDTPLPVQQYAMAIINSGRSLKASARTGCGKTAAFLLPVIDKIVRQGVRTEKGSPQRPRALIISPTHQLAQQIYNDATNFAARTDVKICVCHGGAMLHSETRKIESGTNILIGTLGRTVDHLQRKNVVLDELRFLVFDEADRIMDEDFAEAIDQLMAHIKEARCAPQTLMFSATFAERIMNKIESLFTGHVSLQVGILGTVNCDVHQSVIQVHEDEKEGKLLELLEAEASPKTKTFIFVRSKLRAEKLADFLFRNKIKVTKLHGDLEEYQRTRALKDFNDGVRNVMVATLLGNRGLDVNLVNHVINYDLPESIEQYVNCLGRTGRVGNTGRATSFFDPQHGNDRTMAAGLRLKLEEAGIEEIPDFLLSDS